MQNANVEENLKTIRCEDQCCGFKGVGDGEWLVRLAKLRLVFSAVTGADEDAQLTPALVPHSTSNALSPIM